MRLLCVDPDRVALVWPHVRELILAAMQRGDLSAFRPVEASVLAGDALLWLAVVGSPDERASARDIRGKDAPPSDSEGPARQWENVDPDIAGAALARAEAPAHPGYRIAAAAVTEIADTEWRRVCVIVACGGRDMRARLPLIDGIEAYARAAGCSAVRIVGRKGWARVLARRSPQGEGGYKTKRIILEKEL